MHRKNIHKPKAHFIKRIQKTIFSIFILLCFSSCFLPSDIAVQYYDESLKQAAASFEKEMKRERTTLLLKDSNNQEKVIEVSNCLEFLEQLKKGAEYTGYSRDQLVLSEYQICFTLKASRKVKPSKKSYFINSNLGDLIYNYLDLKTFDSSLQPRINGEKRFVLSQFKFAEAKTTPTGIEIEEEDWYYNIAVLASGDFTGDGLEDLLVLFNDDAKFGTYYDNIVLVLERKEPDGFISGRSLKEFIN